MVYQGYNALCSNPSCNLDRMLDIIRSLSIYFGPQEVLMVSRKEVWLQCLPIGLWVELPFCASAYCERAQAPFNSENSTKAQ